MCIIAFTHVYTLHCGQSDSRITATPNRVLAHTSVYRQLKESFCAIQFTQLRVLLFILWAAAIIMLIIPLQYYQVLSAFPQATSC